MESTKRMLVVCVLLLIIVEISMADPRRECRKKSGVSWGSLKKFKRGNFELNDPKLKCYVKCYMVRSGIANENNEIEIERAVRHLPKNMQESSRRALDKCKTMRGTDSCDTAYEIAKCYFTAHPEIFGKIPLV